MGHCKDCRWWLPLQIDDLNLGGDCKQPDVRLGYSFQDEPLPNSVVVENDEDWAWHTGPEFGCVNFEAKA